MKGYAINEENRGRIYLEDKRILSIALGENGGTYVIQSGDHSTKIKVESAHDFSLPFYF